MKKLLLLVAMVLMCGNAWADDKKLSCEDTAINMYTSAAQILSKFKDFDKSLDYVDTHIKNNYSPQAYYTLRYALVLVNYAPFDNNDNYNSMVIGLQVQHIENLCVSGENNVYNKDR